MKQKRRKELRQEAGLGGKEKQPKGGGSTDVTRHEEANAFWQEDRAGMAEQESELTLCMSLFTFPFKDFLVGTGESEHRWWRRDGGKLKYFVCYCD